MSEKIRDRAILSRFSDALSRGEVQIYLQAQVAADSRRVIGAEALSRCRYSIKSMRGISRSAMCRIGQMMRTSFVMYLSR